MHTATKITLIIGALITVIGIVMFIGGAEVAEVDYENESAFRGDNGTWDYVDDDFYIVYVRGSVSCESFSATMTNSSGNTTDGDFFETPYLLKYDCEDIDMTNISADNYYGIGYITASANETYSMDASHEMFIMGGLQELGEAIGGMMAILGSFGVICCGAFFLLLGGIFALTLKTAEPTLVMVNNAANPMMPGMAMPVTQMAQPQMQQPVQYQQPAQTQMAQPQYQQPGQPAQPVQPAQQPPQQYQQPPQGGL
ncbi:MAG TPA: hypothetical protein EYQ73_00760 [Candidatus Poseidoniales archaeon]|jgi:hypothetical protein|nr:MAG: hypothetical protein CXT71_05355 [Euryarchaeota archaeon]HIF45316.1 hypothetical protein [Candidatus Poseidoniales archaeon]HIL65699.1 hypothetical protein [Candidatus Poseidoniales archaeon]